MCSLFSVALQLQGEREIGDISKAMKMTAND
jgi:hypothetical protein